MYVAFMQYRQGLMMHNCNASTRALFIANFREPMKAASAMLKER